MGACEGGDAHAAPPAVIHLCWRAGASCRYETLEGLKG